MNCAALMRASTLREEIDRLQEELQETRRRLDASEVEFNEQVLSTVMRESIRSWTEKTEKWRLPEVDDVGVQSDRRKCVYVEPAEGRSGAVTKETGRMETGRRSESEGRRMADSDRSSAEEDAFTVPWGSSGRRVSVGADAKAPTRRSAALCRSFGVANKRTDSFAASPAQDSRRSAKLTPRLRNEQKRPSIEPAPAENPTATTNERNLTIESFVPKQDGDLAETPAEKLVEREGHNIIVAEDIGHDQGNTEMLWEGINLIRSNEVDSASSRSDPEADVRVASASIDSKSSLAPTSHRTSGQSETSDSPEPVDMFRSLQRPVTDEDRASSARAVREPSPSERTEQNRRNQTEQTIANLRSFLNEAEALGHKDPFLQETGELPDRALHKLRALLELLRLHASKSEDAFQSLTQTIDALLDEAQSLKLLQPVPPSDAPTKRLQLRDLLLKLQHAVERELCDGQISDAFEAEFRRLRRCAQEDASSDSQRRETWPRWGSGAVLKTGGSAASLDSVLSDLSRYLSSQRSARERWKAAFLKIKRIRAMGGSKWQTSQDPFWREANTQSTVKSNLEIFLYGMSGRSLE